MVIFLKEAESLTMIPDQFSHSPEFKEAFAVIEQSLWTLEEHRAYLKKLDDLNKNNRLQAGIFEEGLEEGIQRKAEVVAIRMLKKIKISLKYQNLLILLSSQLKCSKINCNFNQILLLCVNQ